ncbi:MAG: phosphatase [Solobacterium sp.]|nr:phosphatase [Solobacterium sp.]
MKPLLFDLHTHTIASGHAYSTLLENIQCAKDAGLKAYGFSDHTGEMNVMGRMYFGNFKVIPRRIDDLLILRGAEVNIVDYDGTIDLAERYCKQLDYVIASIHKIPEYVAGSREENTAAVIGAMHNPYVRVIGHPDDGRFPLDPEAIVLAAKETGVLLELNNASLRTDMSRLNARENITEVLRQCKKHGVRIVVNTDSHFALSVGRFELAERLIADLEFPEELIANYDMDRLKWIVREEKIAELGI